MKNIIENFLDALDVRYTGMYAKRLFDEHPNRNNMYGLVQMLRVYGIKAMGVHLEDKDPCRLNFPCILHVDGGFAIGLECDGNNLALQQQGEKSSMPCEVFRQNWTGQALVVDDMEQAGEPDYWEHMRKDLLRRGTESCIPVMLTLAALVGIAGNFGQIPGFALFNLVLYAAGLGICFLLLQKQVMGKSRYADKTCSLLHQADCDSLLKGSYSGILGISWSEVGSGFFVASILLSALYPSAIGPVCLSGWLAMCYGVWSIYCQWRLAKVWCPLCLSVQGIVWIAGIVSACCVRNLTLTFEACTLSSISIAVGIMYVHHSASRYQACREKTDISQKYNALKAKRSVAEILMKESEYYEVSDADSFIFFGNKEAGLRITVLSNPYCAPCARAHAEVEKLLKWYGDGLCIQYIFTAFGQHLEDSCRYLISCYNSEDTVSSLARYSEWYKTGGEGRKKILQAHQAQIQEPEWERQLQKHRHWREVNKLVATPTVLVNGHLLPQEYEIRDLTMLADWGEERTKKNVMYDINGRSTTPLGAEWPSAEEPV